MAAETIIVLAVIAALLVAGVIYFLKQTTGQRGTVRNWGARHYEDTSGDHGRADR